MKERLIAIVGPTAVGKTTVSIALAKALGGEIINGDSMQVYKGMDIGTAKVSEQEKAGIPHHLFDIKDPRESYSVAEFQSLARPLVTEINDRGRIPIVVGGTGLYIKALTHEYDFSEIVADPHYRKEMEIFAKGNGEEALYEKLESVDPESAANIHPNNIRRVIRALEVFHATGEPASHQQQRQRPSPYHLITVGLTMDRNVLYRRINCRVDQMIANGLIEEARTLYNSGVRDCQAVQAIGYKEVYSYFEGEQSKEEMIEQLKTHSRRYAKRQYTWFRRQMDVQWFDMTSGDINKKITAILRFVGGKL